jgi:hypothetical protein
MVLPDRTGSVHSPVWPCVQSRHFLAPGRPAGALGPPGLLPKWPFNARNRVRGSPLWPWQGRSSRVLRASGPSKTVESVGGRSSSGLLELRTQIREGSTEARDLATTPQPTRFRADQLRLAPTRTDSIAARSPKLSQMVARRPIWLATMGPSGVHTVEWRSLCGSAGAGVILPVSVSRIPTARNLGTGPPPRPPYTLDPTPGYYRLGRSRP